MKEENVTNKKQSVELVTNCDRLPLNVESLIQVVRNQQVMLDYDLATLYNVETKVLNQSVRRNIERFPAHFRYQLSQEEMDELVTNCDRLRVLKHSTVLPYVFTEQGVAMLSTVLRSPRAIATSIRIMDAFVAMRHLMASNIQMLQRIANIEYHQIETDKHITESDKRIDKVFQLLDQGAKAKQGIFYDGQIFDAYIFATNLIKSSKKRIILIDNYIDETTLTLFDKRGTDISATIYTKQITSQLSLDLSRHNSQYPPIAIRTYNKAHDRFLVIDDKVYHIGASLKDLGKKIFAFSLMENLPASELLSHLSDSQ